MSMRDQTNPTSSSSSGGGGDGLPLVPPKKLDRSVSSVEWVSGLGTFDGLVGELERMMREESVVWMIEKKNKTSEEEDDGRKAEGKDSPLESPTTTNEMVIDPTVAPFYFSSLSSSTFYLPSSSSSTTISSTISSLTELLDRGPIVSLERCGMINNWNHHPSNDENEFQFEEYSAIRTENDGKRL